MAEDASPREASVWDTLDTEAGSPRAAPKPKTISRGIVRGTIATSKGKKLSDEEASHKWSCYVRGPDDYDISTFIKQVVFTLHPSFNNQVRYLKSPPFEVHEEGWGEFDIGIKIYFWPDSNLRPIEILHQLKLYPNDAAAANQSISKKPVVNEIYEELVFTDPEPTYAKRLTTKVLGAGNQSALQRYDAEIRPHFRRFDDSEADKQVNRVRKVCQTVMELSAEHRERLAAIAKEVDVLEKDIQGMGGDPVKCQQISEEEVKVPKGFEAMAKDIAGGGLGILPADDAGGSTESSSGRGRGGRKGGRKRQKR